MTTFKPIIPVWLVVLGFALYPAISFAIVDVAENVELEGFVKAQNILRTPKFADAELIMQRNTAQIEGKYYFLKEGVAFNRFSTGSLEEATFSFIGRAVYDSVYDIRDDYSGLNGRSEAELREAFVDFVLPPFTLRLGRQQVVWGETDNFRALDVINPLDLGWHWSRESWEDIRIPLWMARGIYDIGKIGPFEEAFLETIWIPMDFRRNKVETNPRRPWAFTGAGLAGVANSVVIDDELFNLDVEVRNRTPSKKLKNGQAGMRFKAILGNVDFSFNYFFGFSSDIGAKVPSTLSRIIGDTFHATVETVNPRSHVVGIAANYSEERYTKSVFRVETAFTTGVPVWIAAGASRQTDPNQDQYETARRSVLMLGMDRPTWIKALNGTRTVFLSSQFFWRRYLDYSSSYRGIPSIRQAEVGGVAIPGRFISENTDKLDRDEFVMTFSASTNYGQAGLIQPRFVFAMDPLSTGAYNQFSVDYLWTEHIVFRAQQHLYWRLSGDKPGPWALGDIWGRSNASSRHETLFSVIFQF
jgi:hypothetical protein